MLAYPSHLPPSSPPLPTGVVLMHGEVTDKLVRPKHITEHYYIHHIFPQNPLEAQCLANQLNIYYLGTPHDFQHVQWFNRQPAKFDHNALITRLQTLDAAAKV